MKLLPLKKLLAMSADKLNEALAPIRARQAQSQARLSIGKLEAELLTIESNIQEECSKKDFSVDKIVDYLDKAAILERRMGKLKEVIIELFPEDDKAQVDEK